jgi:hypothetical protein
MDLLGLIMFKMLGRCSDFDHHTTDGKKRRREVATPWLSRHIFIPPTLPFSGSPSSVS